MAENTRRWQASDMLSSLQSRASRLFWFGATLSSVGQAAFLVSSGWLAFQLSGSGAVGLVTFATTGPLLFATLAGGVLADRSDRRKVVLSTQCVQGTVALFVGGNILGLSAADESQQQAAAVSAIVSAKDSQQAKAAVAGGGTATFVWSVGLRQSAVVIDKLPKLTGDKTYELWYIDKGSHATPAGIFNAASSGTTVSVLAGLMSAGDTFGITVEPSGGSHKPTTAPIVAVPSA